MDARNIRLNSATKCNAQKIHAREVRIDKQCASFEFELVTVRSEISHAHTVARSRLTIAHCELSVGRQSRSESMRCECQEKQKTHATTHNADAADVEAKSSVLRQTPYKICSSVESVVSLV